MVAALRERLRSRTVQIVVIAVLVLAAAGVVAAVASSSDSVTTRSQFIPGTPEAGKLVRLDTTLYIPSGTPAPAVLLTQGFGGDKTGLAGTAKTLASHGYVVLTYSARGFGRSGGLIHFASPDYEIRDASLLVSYLSGLPQVEKVAGRAQIGAAGSSYGGGISLLLAAADHRVGAVAADITWNDLSHAFFPNNVVSSTEPGVFKRLYVGSLFGNGFGGTQSALAQLAAGKQPKAPTGSVSCGNFAPNVCSAYQASAAAGAPTAAMTAIMTAASPATYLSKIDAPTLLTQGEQDSLFPLTEADANARGIAAHGTPVRVVWRQGGHDDSSVGGGTVTSAAISWFGKSLGKGKDNVGKSQPFQFSEQAGVVSAATGDADEQVLRAAGYPGVAGTAAARTRSVTVRGVSQPVSSPAGGSPATITSIPGLGGVLNTLSSVGGALALPAAPGQTATFVSSALDSELRIVGASTVRLTVTPQQSGDVVLFAGLRDLDRDGASTLPSQLVSPLRLTGARAGIPMTVTVRLPAVVRNVLAGHRLALTISTTDFAYANETTPRTYTITLDGGTPAITVPTVAGTTVSGGHPIAWLIVGLVVVALVALGVTGVFIRRRLVLKSVPELADVPVSIENLVKEYKGGYRAVDDVSFRVEKGQVVGLLGPNGAGKTTALRTLVGLITPTSGAIHIFGEPVVPGAPVLARLGSFIEGPGFLPHLSGRDNLRLYWAATGRPDDEAEFGVALDIAGLGGSIDRRVRAYSQGMRQRLGIAQAMLGLPELLVLDEPTNGLDPPQIAEMREVLRQYAQTGRTVIVSSHLLAEVEQTCTHVVVMHRGRLVASGSVDEVVAGTAGSQLAVDDPEQATRVLTAAGIGSQLVPARRALEDVFLDLIGGDD
ncbi:alpha/beta fold hydrolase [uncultured Jatrophihabitans sp.]|uniref:alpha/beta fold hydrolase n=1 Tax=uncultured Jatrophihabitans sp. TaxID=1610747 RepID=UPI0035CBF4DF